MLSKNLGLMFKVKQLFTKNYQLLLQITLFLVRLNSFYVIRSQSLQFSKSYQNNQASSIEKLLGVPNGFLLYSEITQSDLKNSSNFIQGHRQKIFQRREPIRIEPKLTTKNEKKY